MSTTTEALQRYLQALSATYDVMADEGTKAMERGSRVSAKLVSEVVAGQRDVLSLARKLAADPDRFMVQSLAALTEAAVASQSRALAFTQLAYQESMDANGEMREAGERIAAANRELTDAAGELARQWNTMYPAFETLMKTWQAGSRGSGEPAAAQA